MIKRIFSILLVLALCLGLFTNMALATGENENLALNATVLGYSKNAPNEKEHARYALDGDRDNTKWCATEKEGWMVFQTKKAITPVSMVTYHADYSASETAKYNTKAYELEILDPQVITEAEFLAKGNDEQQEIMSTQSYWTRISDSVVGNMHSCRLDRINMPGACSIFRFHVVDAGKDNAIRIYELELLAHVPVLKGISLEPITINLDENLNLQPQFTPEYCVEPLTYSVANPDIAEVVDGVLYSKSVGTTTITVTADNSPQIQAKTKVTVNERKYLELLGYVPIWRESFEGDALPDGWTTEDRDGDGHCWELRTSGANARVHHNKQSICSDSRVNSQDFNPNNWLITPEFLVGYDYVFTSQILGSDNGSGVEGVKLYILEEGKEPEFYLGITNWSHYQEWRKVEAYLDEYEGRRIRIAIAHNNENPNGTLSLDCAALWRPNLKEHTAQVVFKVQNGTWDGQDKNDKIQEVQLTNGYGTLPEAAVPTNIQPDPGCENGSWNMTPNITKDGIIGDVTYTYTFAHAHQLLLVPGKAATCTETGTKEHWHCSSCGQNFADKDGKTEITDPNKLTIPAIGHEWGAPIITFSEDGKSATALVTCTKDTNHTIDFKNVEVSSKITTPATCSVKGTTDYTATVEFEGSTFSSTKSVQDVAINPANHSNLKKVNEKPAACTENGTKEYWHCTGCNKNFADADGKTEVTDLTIAATGHNWGTTTYEWSQDGKTCKATRVCQNADKYKETVNAAVTSKTTKQPTETEMGQTTYTATFNVAWATQQTKVLNDNPVKEHTHIGTQVTGQAPTCTTDGWKDYYKCQCGKFFEDEACTKEITELAAWKTGDGKIEKISHTPGDWKQDDSEHWKECTSCHTIVEKAKHTYSDWTVIKAASETEEGLEKHACTFCGHEETRSIPKLNHTHSFGDSWKKDKTNHWHECSCGEKADVTAHSYEWIIDKEATETTDGAKHQHCTVCGYNAASVTIPAAKVPQDKPADTAEKVEAKPLNTVPEGLKDTEFNTVEKIQQAMEKVVLTKIGEQNTGNAHKTIVYDAVLMITENGVTRPATKEEIEARGGITIMFPYPAGTNKTDYVFTVAHMLTMDMAGMKAGDIETPEITLTDAGLQVTLKGLSPIMVGYSKKAAEPTPAEPTVPETTAPTVPVPAEPTIPETTAPTTPAPAEPTTPETTAPTAPVTTELTKPNPSKEVDVPKTGDESNILLWSLLGFAAAFGMIGTALFKKKKKNS